MFTWDLLVFLWLVAAGFCVGFGWALGVLVVEKLKNGRRA